jgi:Protein of unknown function (DUF1402)
LGVFGDPASIERLAQALLGSSGHDGVAKVVQEVRDQVRGTVGSLVPSEWWGEAANAFAQMVNDHDVHDLTALSEAIGGVGPPLMQLATDLRAANKKGDLAQLMASNVGFGFDIDSSGHTSDDWIHAIEQHIPGLVDGHELSAARDEMLAGRHIAEQAWDTARRALGSVQVPKIGSDTLHDAERWAFEDAALPKDIPDRNAGPHSGLPPTKTRSNGYLEDQRREAIKMVQQLCLEIKQAAEHYGVPPEAIAGAILWEALENPHKSPPEPWDPGPGPGKVHWYEVPPTWNSALHAEEQGKIPGVDPNPAIGEEERRQRVIDPKQAIWYIGAILSDDVDIYRSVAQVDISQNVGVLLTLYQGVAGGPPDSAGRLAARREHDPSAQPAMAGGMGPWVTENIQWVKGQLPCL